VAYLTEIIGLPKTWHLPATKYAMPQSADAKGKTDSRGKLQQCHLVSSFTGPTKCHVLQPEGLSLGMQRSSMGPCPYYHHGITGAASGFKENMQTFVVRMSDERKRFLPKR